MSHVPAGSAAAKPSLGIPPSAKAVRVLPDTATTWPPAAIAAFCFLLERYARRCSPELPDSRAGKLRAPP